MTEEYKTQHRLFLMLYPYFTDALHISITSGIIIITIVTVTEIAAQASQV